jgi:hypothetical protein
LQKKNNFCEKETLTKRTNVMKKILIILIAIWILLVYYPNPMMLFGSVARFIDPVQSEQVIDFAEIMPNNSTEIERLTEDYIQVETDWEQYKVPWYFPSAEQVVNEATGDCKHRAVLLASVLDAKGIEYDFRFGVTHFWVDYDDKYIGEFEEKWESGKAPPTNFLIKNYYSYLFGAIPLDRKVLLIVGPIVIILISMLIKKKRSI